MRITLATALLVALAVTAAGQPPKADSKPDQKAEKADQKADPKADAKADPKAAAKGPPTPQYPTQIGGKDLDKWIREIDHPDPSQKVSAINTVLGFGPNAKRAIPVLIRTLRNVNNDMSVRAHAVYALRQLVPLDLQNYGKEAVDALTVALDSSQQTVKVQAAHALWAIGPAARVSVPKLSKLVVDRTVSFEIRQAAALALGRVAYDDQGGPSIQALNFLLDGVDDPSKEVRMECLQSIINLGPPAQGASAQYKNLLERRIKAEKDNSARIWVRVALMRLDAAFINETNLNEIAKLMKEMEDLDIRVQSARAIGYIGPAAKSMVPALISALPDPEPLMVWQVIWSLAQMVKFAEPALPHLKKIAADDKVDAGIREAARKAIETIEADMKKK